ncbi:hypothetical protein SEUCBS140593_000126 [Sporothrix eucalyptigena]|uniref:Something about silencing protein 4 domain-containing protein n=1 Tax=Sporothrix eucalyptigena TaxID=1812306 RepID=A0ABP0AL50_9PEZI
MLETLTILPMAPGTRSRRADVLHRATPVLLPKPKQRQTTLDQHLRSVAARPNSATTRPPPPQSQALQQSPQQSQQAQAPQQRASRQQRPAQQQQQQQQQQLQRQQQQQSQSQPQQQQLSFASAGPTRSIQNILNHANSMGPMSASRPKRKIAADADAKPETNGHASGSNSGYSSGKASSSRAEADADDSTRDSALRKRPRLAVEIVDYAKPRGLAVGTTPVVLQQTALPPPKPGAVTKTKTKTANNTSSSLAALPIAAPSSASASANTSTPPTTISQPSTTRPLSARQQNLPPTLERTTRDKAPAAPPEASSSIPPSSDPASARPLRPAGRTPSKPVSQLATKPQKEKAVNGFKQELKSLQVSTEDAVAVARGSREGGRKLRSQEATRFKSELAAYFPDYDEVIGNEPKEEHLLNIDTPIVFVESSAEHPATSLLPSTSSISTPLAASLRSSDRVGPVRVKGYGDKLFYDVFDSHVLDFTFLGNQHKSKGAVDPLPDSYFEVHHKRAERLERSIRNTEKGRAQHEKDQIIRLLEGLQGPDWLRTMGVSGITESKKKTFEPAREHFIRGCRAILEKFRLWSVEEKRRKLEKDRAHAEEVKAREAAAEAAAAAAHHGRGKGKAKADSTASKSKKRRDVPSRATGRGAAKRGVDEDNEMEEPDDEGDDVAEDEEEDEDAVADEDDVDDDSQPDSSDFDAVIAQQLREEALARSRLASKAEASTNKRRKPSRGAKQDTKEASLPLSPERPQEEVKSFFRKRYQRDAALSRGRRKGRTVLAWGQPVPEVPENEFHLPGDILEEQGTTRGSSSGRGRRGGPRGGTRSVGRK